MASCFVIMPVSTPESLVPRYGGDNEHFRHVLECLFIPAIRDAKLDPIPPIAPGSDLIHANIIQNLVTADLVLCDISALNPNVFFELGCRTALNKPVCYVKDDLTAKIPFDNAIINHHTYQAALRPWSMEIVTLSKHLRESKEQSKDENRLWKYFGIRAKADALKSQGANKLDKIDFLLMQMESLKKSIEEINRPAMRDVTRGFQVADAPEIPVSHTTVNPGDTIDWGDPSAWNTWLIDDQKTIRDAAKDLDHLERMRTRNLPPGSLEPVKCMLEGHLTALSDALRRGLSSTETVQAEYLVARINNLLGGWPGDRSRK